MLTAIEARMLFEGKNVDSDSEFTMLMNFILGVVERRAKEGHTDYWCSLFLSDDMAERVKDQLESLGYIIEDDLSSASCFKIYW